MLEIASKYLDTAVDEAFEKLKAQAEGATISALFTKAGIARKKARTRDFINGALEFFAAKVLVANLSSRWNETAECLPCLDGVIDFTGEEIIARAPKNDEYFKDPLPVKTADILREDIPASFLLFLDEVFPDPEVRRTALECVSLAVANKGSRTFYLWHGSGANGKNTLLDGLRIVLGARVGTIPAGAIIRSHDGSGRFAAAALNGLTFAAVDEVSAPLDTSEIKKLTGNSSFSIEEKGRQSFEITQRWALVALTNRLPTFAPANDSAFTERMIIVPFDSVFYFNDEQKRNYIDLGVPAERLIQARDRVAIMDGFDKDRARILRLLIQTYMKVRAAGGRPFEGKRCYQLKQNYIDANDLIADFFKEHFLRADGERMPYMRILELYRDYTGDRNVATRTCIQKLIARFPWMQKTVANGVRYLVNIRERDGNDNEPDTGSEAKNSSESQETLLNAESANIEDTSFSKQVRKNGTLRSPLEKCHFSYIYIKTPVFRTTVLENDPSVLSDSDLLLASKTASELLKAAKDAGKVPIGRWRNACAAKGMDPQKIAAAENYMRGIGLLDGEFIKQPDEGDQTIKPAAMARLGMPSAGWPASLKNSEDGDGLGIF
jgi:phage/plasmid-associated DNA primase